jgi:hypothetical protein
LMRKHLRIKSQTAPVLTSLPELRLSQTFYLSSICGLYRGRSKQAQPGDNSPSDRKSEERLTGEFVSKSLPERFWCPPFAGGFFLQVNGIVICSGFS